MPGKKKKKPRWKGLLAHHCRDLLEIGAVGSTLWIRRPNSIVITHVAWLNKRHEAMRALSARRRARAS